MSGPQMGGRYVVRISPDDVGARVSVRSRTGQDDAGPRFTDTLGVLESWEGGVLVIRRRDGEAVSVDEPSVVAGKVIPPAPPRRGRPTG